MSVEYQPGILILAAGASRRFNGVKQLAQLGDDTLLQNTLNAVAQLSVRENCCVLGANAEEIKAAVYFETVFEIKTCPNWQDGLSASIAFGIRQLQKCSHVLMVLGDQPDITTNHFERLLEHSVISPDKIITACYGGRNGAPAIFPKRFFPVLLNLKGDRGAGQFLNGALQQEHIHSMMLEEAAIDIDTPEDLSNWQNKRTIKHKAEL